MADIFNQDEWSKSFAHIFQELVTANRAGKKVIFCQNVGLNDPSLLAKIVNGKRNFPLHLRQQAMNALRDLYQVNLEYFQNRTKPVLSQQQSAGFTVMAESKSEGIYLQYLKGKEEILLLKKMLEDKDKIIEAQSALIQVLKEKLQTTT